MSATEQHIERFFNGQVAAWNAGDKAAFLEHYRAVSPKGLTIEYVGEGLRDPWATLEKMWDDQNAKVEVEVIQKIVNGPEAACYHRNHIRGADMAIDTVELYAFDAGKLAIRYFIAPVAGNG